MKWHKKGVLLFANSDKIKGLVYIVNWVKKQLFIYQGKKKVYFSDDKDEVNRFLMEFDFDFWYERIR